MLKDNLHTVLSLYHYKHLLKQGHILIYIFILRSQILKLTYYLIVDLPLCYPMTKLLNKFGQLIDWSFVRI